MNVFHQTVIERRMYPMESWLQGDVILVIFKIGRGQLTHMLATDLGDANIRFSSFASMPKVLGSYLAQQRPFKCTTW
jgi:dihydroxyacetone kinase DhaKLM complex PTS-EIIA-like component DhaM